MTVKEEKKATGNEPKVKMVTEAQVVRMVKEFAAHVIISNAYTAKVLDNYLSKFEDDHEGIRNLDFILGYVSCSEEERLKVFEERYEDPKSLEMMMVALTIRCILGLGKLNDNFE